MDHLQSWQHLLSGLGLPGEPPQGAASSAAVAAARTRDVTQQQVALGRSPLSAWSRILSHLGGDEPRAPPGGSPVRWSPLAKQQQQQQQQRGRSSKAATSPVDKLDLLQLQLQQQQAGVASPDASQGRCIEGRLAMQVQQQQQQQQQQPALSAGLHHTPRRQHQQQQTYWPLSKEELPRVPLALLLPTTSPPAAAGAGPRSYGSRNLPDKPAAGLPATGGVAGVSRGLSGVAVARMSGAQGGHLELLAPQQQQQQQGLRPTSSSRTQRRRLFDTSSPNQDAAGYTSPAAGRLLGGESPAASFASGSAGGTASAGMGLMGGAAVNTPSSMATRLSARSRGSPQLGHAAYSTPAAAAAAAALAVAVAAAGVAVRNSPDSPGRPSSPQAIRQQRRQQRLAEAELVALQVGLGQPPPPVPPSDLDITGIASSSWSGSWGAGQMPTEAAGGAPELLPRPGSVCAEVSARDLMRGGSPSRSPGRLRPAAGRVLAGSGGVLLGPGQGSPTSVRAAPSPTAAAAAVGMWPQAVPGALSSAATAAAGPGQGGAGDSVAVLANAVGQLTTLLEQMLRSTPAAAALTALPTQPPVLADRGEAVQQGMVRLSPAAAKGDVGAAEAVAPALPEEGGLGSMRTAAPGVAPVSDGGGQQQQQQRQQQQRQWEDGEEAQQRAMQVMTQVQQQQAQRRTAGGAGSSRQTSAAGVAAEVGTTHLAQQMQRQLSAVSASCDELECREDVVEGRQDVSQSSGGSMQGGSRVMFSEQQPQLGREGSEAPAGPAQISSSSRRRRSSNTGSAPATLTAAAVRPQESQEAGGAPGDGDAEVPATTAVRIEGDQGSAAEIEGGQESEGQEASTPAAVLRGPRGPACSEQEVLDTARQLTTPMLANSSCAVVELSAAWRTEAVQAQEGWHSLLQEWDAEGGSISGTPPGAAAADDAGSVAAMGTAAAAAAAARADGNNQKQQQVQAAADGGSPNAQAPAEGSADGASPLQAFELSPGLSECSEVSLAVSAARHLAASGAAAPRTAAGLVIGTPQAQAPTAAAAAPEVLSPLKPVAFDFGALEEGGDSSPQATWSGGGSSRSSSSGLHGSKPSAEAAHGGEQPAGSRNSDTSGVVPAAMAPANAQAHQQPRVGTPSSSSGGGGGGGAHGGGAGGTQPQVGSQLADHTSQRGAVASSSSDGDGVSRSSSQDPPAVKAATTTDAASTAEAVAGPAIGVGGGSTSSSSSAGAGSCRTTGAGVALESPAAQAASLEARMQAMYQQLRQQDPLPRPGLDASKPLHPAGSSSRSMLEGAAPATAGLETEILRGGPQGVQAGAALLLQAKDALYGNSAETRLAGGPAAAAGGGAGNRAALTAMGAFGWLSPTTLPLSSSSAGATGVGSSSNHGAAQMPPPQQQQQQWRQEEALSSRSAILSSLRASAARLSSGQGLATSGRPAEASSSVAAAAGMGSPGGLTYAGASLGPAHVTQYQQQLAGGTQVLHPRSPTLAALLAAPAAAATGASAAGSAALMAGGADPLTTPRAAAVRSGAFPLGQERWGTPPPAPAAATPAATAAVGAVGVGGSQGVSPWLQSRSVQHVLQRADVDALGTDLARLRAQLAAGRPSAAAAKGGGRAGASSAAAGRRVQQQQHMSEAGSASSWRVAGGGGVGVSPVTPAAARPLAALLHNNSSTASNAGGRPAAASGSGGGTPGAYQAWPTRQQQQQSLVGAGEMSSSSLYAGAAAGTPITPIASNTSSSFIWTGAAATADAPRQRPLQGSEWRAGARTHGDGGPVNRQAARQFDQHMRQLQSATANMRVHTGAPGAAAGAQGVAAASSSLGSPYQLNTSSMSVTGYGGALVPGVSVAASGSGSRVRMGAMSAPGGGSAGDHSRSQQLAVLASHLQQDAELMRAESAQQQADAVLQRDAMRDRRPPSPTLLHKWAREGSPTRQRRQQERKQAAVAGASATAVASALYSSSSSSHGLGLGSIGLEGAATHTGLVSKGSAAAHAAAAASSLPGSSLSPWRPLADEPQVLSIERVQETLSNVLQLQAATATAARQGPVQVGGGGRASPTALLRRQRAGLGVV